MKYLGQLCLILLFSFLGELCNLLIPLPIPASIYGMALLFLSMRLKLLPVTAVKEAGSFLTSLLPVLFVAPVVGLMDHWELLKENVIALVLITVASTVAVFAVAGLVTKLFLRKEDRHG